MAKAVVTGSQDWVKITELCGGDRMLIIYDPTTSELEVPDVTQAALDTALASYKKNQVTIDAATEAARAKPDRDSAKTKLSALGFTDAEIDRII